MAEVLLVVVERVAAIDTVPGRRSPVEPGTSG
jgi:hypothetical protein